MLTGRLVLFRDPRASRRQPSAASEDSGPFGKRRNARHNTARLSARPPVKRENANVEEFGRLFSMRSQRSFHNLDTKTAPSRRTSSLLDNTNSSTKEPDEVEPVATECILYGYRDKDVEWKVIDKYERLSSGFICEDYPRTDPDITPTYPLLYGESSGIPSGRPALTADANRKSKRYAGGYHWIKVTFDSAPAAERACQFSPQEIDGCLVYCQIYQGHGPVHDTPVFKETGPLLTDDSTPLTPNVKESTSTWKPWGLSQEKVNMAPETPFFSRLAEFEKARPDGIADDTKQDEEPSLHFRHTALSRSDDPSRAQEDTMEPQQQEPHIPGAVRADLRPASEALPPQPSLFERILLLIPFLGWLTGDIVGDGPVVKDDGSFDFEQSSLYWRFWFIVDFLLGTDLCGLKTNE